MLLLRALLLLLLLAGMLRLPEGHIVHASAYSNGTLCELKGY
jgi:hypothetical protein